MVMRPTSSPLSPTTSSFSMRCLCSSTLAACVSTPGETVMSSRVIRLMTGWSRLVSKRTSRLVRMPTGLPSCTTGRPEISCCRMISSACASGWSGRTVMGSTIMPLSARFTFSTWVACSSAVRFLWMMPMPPSRAMMTAVRHSVTVSMALDTMGMRSSRPRVSRVLTSASLGRKSA